MVEKEAQASHLLAAALKLAGDPEPAGPTRAGIPPGASASLGLTAEGPGVSGRCLGRGFNSDESFPSHRAFRMEPQLLDLKTLSWGFPKPV